MSIPRTITLLTAILCCVTAFQSHAQPVSATSEVLFSEDFSQAEVGKKPKGFLILEGKFVIAEEEGNRLLELPGEPLESFGLLFGPTLPDGIYSTAAIWGESKKRTGPAFGVGLNGVSGFKLILSPQKKTLDLMRGNETKASAEYAWKSGTWTLFKLQSTKVGDKWLVQGKAWTRGEAEPEAWLVTSEETKNPPNGRPSIWGTPYSGKKILFDDLSVGKAK